MDKVTRQCPQITIFLKRKESRSGIEPRSFRLPAYRLTARPNQLTFFSLFLSVLLFCCFTSTEARWLIRDGDRVGRGRKSEGSTKETARKRPERPWTATRTMEVLRHCPLAIAQRPVHCAIAVSTAVLGQSQSAFICPLYTACAQTWQGCSMTVACLFWSLWLHSTLKQSPLKIV